MRDSVELLDLDFSSLSSDGATESSVQRRKAPSRMMSTMITSWLMALLALCILMPHPNWMQVSSFITVEKANAAPVADEPVIMAQTAVTDSDLVTGPVIADTSEVVSIDTTYSSVSTKGLDMPLPMSSITSEGLRKLLEEAAEDVTPTVVPYSFNINVIQDVPLAPEVKDSLPKLTESVAYPRAGNGGKVSYLDFPEIRLQGTESGRLTIPRININNFGVRLGSQPEIDAGVCQYHSWELPGDMKGRVMVGAHNYNPIWKIGNIKTGDKIYYNTAWGDYVYEAYRAFVNYEGRDTFWLRDSYYAMNPGDLALITCYPFDSDGKDGVRYLVFCRLVSGPELVDSTVGIGKRFPTWESMAKARKIPEGEWYK